MKKHFHILIAALVAAMFALAACSSGGASSAASSSSEASAASSDAAAGVSGTYTGQAVGHGGEGSPVTVTLTLENSEIVDFQVEGPGETAGVGSKAIEQFPAQIIEGNTLDIDAISGATETSTAIIEAATAALAEAGLTPSDLVAKQVASASSSSSAASGPTEIETDVVVVGAGGAGMVASITAADAGKKVVLLESTALVGGNSVRSTGGMNAAKTEWQDANEFGEEAGVEKQLAAAEAYTGANEQVIKDLAAKVKEQWEAYKASPEGYFDTTDLFVLDTMIGGKGLNDISLVTKLAEESESAIEWMGENDMILHNVSSFGGASVKRIHRPVGDDGKVVSVGSYLVPILEKKITDRGVDLHLNTKAEKILTEGGVAIGVEAVDADGNKVTVYANSVVITTGGFGANNDMIKELKPEIDGYVTTNAPGIQGEGIVMAQEVGADVVDMDQIQLHPTVHVQDGAASLITEGLRGDGAILVNQEGKRFFDEVSTRDKVSAAENEQTGGFAWLIVDQKMLDASNVIKGYVDKGWTVTGATAEDLAKEMDVDAATLAATIETWNGYVAEKNDPDFGRTSFAEPLEGPYYALTVQPGIHHTMGGIKINDNAEVIDTAGKVIPGLFAAGEVTGGVHGANRLGGNAVADFNIFGRIAGQSAADYSEEVGGLAQAA